MKIIFLAFLALSNLLMCEPYMDRPYSGSILSKDGRKDSVTYTLPNGMQVVYRGVNYDYFKHKAGSFVYCAVVNPTAGKLSLDRGGFTVKSAKGVPYKPYSIKEYPSVFPVEGGGRADYVFIFRTDSAYEKKDWIDLVKTDTIYYLHSRHGVTDTLFSVVPNDSRLAPR